MSDVKHKISVRGREKVGNVVTYLVLFLFIALMIIPIFWGFLTSWKGTAEISRFPPTMVLCQDLVQVKMRFSSS